MKPARACRTPWGSRGWRQSSTSRPSGCSTRLRDLREDGDLTQTQLAEYLGVHQTTYSDYELGRLNIPLRTLCSIADFYGVSTDYLLRRTSNPEPYER